MLKQRILTAVVALGILTLVVFCLPPVVARIAIAAVFVIGAWEWGGFLYRTGRLGRLVYVTFVAALMTATWVNAGEPAWLDTLLRVGLAWWMLALVWLLFFPTPIPVSINWICGALVLVPAWAAVDHLYTQYPSKLLFFYLFIVWATDIGAYFVGKRFGRVKLAPAISPGKTWEGVLGGLAAVALLVAAASSIMGWELTALIPFCLAVAMLSIIGDLTISMFKRTAGVKDSGSLFPGHGGVLDRIDSVTAASPLYVYALAWTGLS
ncbi:MAG: phosphatidate cytidylyltransferase [Pseudomonadota bacterium]|nr:phosphatidate cytidylyltransferase [Pseudomonadota bacterium]